MSDVFRVMENGAEIHRSIDLIGACVVWVKNPACRSVERIPVGSTSEGTQVQRFECCTALNRWFLTNRHFVSEDERKDMEQFINEACGTSV